ncbi:large ribosomal subunit protein P3-like [Cornus florida]|uniref:large ribosomal subunit protein P3-like n=1 Tax=Cornus florida TaxID=4283 RepID=UPI00289A5810|nr:large ribosomal subunit protein P3-like [Cornus florida]
MGVFTFVCRSSGKDWSAKQLFGDLEASAGSTYELQRKLVQEALSCDSSCVQSSFSLITPSSAVFQVIVGGSIGGGGATTAAPGGGGAPATEAPPAPEKKEEKEESDDDIGFSLFD